MEVEVGNSVTDAMLLPRAVAYGNSGRNLKYPYLRPAEYKRSRLSRNRRTVNRAYGGVLSGSVVNTKCSINMDGKYILAGGEDDLVQVWSMEDRKEVAWEVGHRSWVSGVSFDSYWSSPASYGTGEGGMYRLGSVGQIRNV